MNTARLDGVTISRFVAAFYVFIFHANMRVPIDLGGYFNGVVSNGAIGMSLFFVLSGFVLTYKYDSGVTKDYILKRIKRIYPAYIFAGIITLPLLIPENGDFDISKTITSIMLFVFSIQAWFYQAFSVWNFGGTWSVSVEVFFYIIFPFMLMFLRKNNTIMVLLIAYLATSIIIPVSMVLQGQNLFPVYYSNPIYRFPEFLFGMACAKLMLDGFYIRNSFFIVVIGIFFWVSSIPNLGYMQYNFLIVPIIGVSLIWLSQQSFKRNLITIPLVYLGEISYSFYLMQVVLMVAIDHYHIKITYLSSVEVWILMFLVILITSHFCYQYIEKNRSIHSFIDITAQKVSRLLSVKQA